METGTERGDRERATPVAPALAAKDAPYAFVLENPSD
jgi:hypothetical protein